MQASTEHVQYQLPNEHSRVGFLLEAIQCSDPELQAALASIKTDNGLEGMRNNFEATAAHLLPYDPVAKKRSSGQKRCSAQISSVVDTSNATMKKPSIGKTGVHLRYYKTAEYRNLNREQKDELREWRSDNPNISKAGLKKAKITGFYPSPKSFWSCTHVNSCQNYTLYINLHILLNIICKTTSNI